VRAESSRNAVAPPLSAGHGARGAPVRWRPVTPRGP